MDKFKAFQQERKEHPWLTSKQAWRIVSDHARGKK